MTHSCLHSLQSHTAEQCGLHQATALLLTVSDDLVLLA